MRRKTNPSYITKNGVSVLRTPDSQFADLEDFPFESKYAEVDGMRMHYIDENSDSKKLIVLLHGEPTWCYTYRHLIPALSEAGYRVIAPDLIGFGKSDKPMYKKDYSYQQMVEWTSTLLFANLNLQHLNLVVHDWGGLIGLRLVAQNPEKFSSVVAMNTAFPRLEGINPFYMVWRYLSPLVLKLPVSRLYPIGFFDKSRINQKCLAAYDVPFPSKAYKVAPPYMPKLVPIYPWDKEVWENRRLWKKLIQFDKPFLTLFSDRDPFTKKVERKFISYIVGAKNQPHLKLKNVGHFIHEEQGELVVSHLLTFFNKIV